MKDTALDWFIKELFDKTGIILTKETNPTLFELVQQAKEMEKQQIIDAWIDAFYNGTIGNEVNYQDPEQYYNETFNK